MTAPPSFPAAWRARVQALARALVGLARLSQALWQRFLFLPLAASGALILIVLAWSCERRARFRQALEAEQGKKQAAADVAELQAHAAAAMREANQQHAQAVRELESSRQKLAREAEGLRERLESLRHQELARLDEVATLPTTEVVTRVATRLGPGGFEASGRTSAKDSGSEVRASGAREGGPSAGSPRSADAPTGELPVVSSASTEKPAAASLNPESRLAGAPTASSAAAPRPLTLTEQGARQVETAFLELDSCRQQAGLLDQQVQNCRDQAKLSAAMIEQQAAALAKLNAALADKDQILARREAQLQAEIKAARGSWRSRLWRAVQYFAAGVVAGVIMR